MPSFRQQWAPIIAQVIARYPNQPLAIIRRWLVREWHTNVKTDANAYMHSEYSRECTFQLRHHRDNQVSCDDLPLFLKK